MVVEANPSKRKAATRGKREAGARSPTTNPKDGIDKNREMDKEQKAKEGTGSPLKKQSKNVQFANQMTEVIMIEETDTGLPQGLPQGPPQGIPMTPTPKHSDKAPAA